MREFLERTKVKKLLDEGWAKGIYPRNDIMLLHEFTEQEIVKPYFERLKQAMKERNEDNGGEPLNAIDKGYNLAFEHMCLEIDKILSEQEHSSGTC